MEKCLNKFNFELTTPYKKIGVGVSGGMDSMCLLDNLMKGRKTGGYEVVVINIDHHLRETSKRDSDFVKRFCDEHNLKLVFQDVDVIEYSKIHKSSIEQSARELRYGVFERCINDKTCDVIALGHHKNDNVETVLINLFKGAALKGVCGIAESRANFIRPMIEVTRAEIEKYINENSIEYVTDETNFNDDFERNFVRNQILPLIATKFPNAINAIDSFSKLATRDESFLNSEAEKIVHFSNSPYIFIDDFKNEAVCTRAILLCLKALGAYKDVYNVNIMDVIKLANKLENGSRVDILDDISAFRDYDKITFARRIDLTSDVELPIKFGDFQLSVGRLSIKMEEKFKKVANPTYIDFDKLPNNAIIRTRRSGDIFLRDGGSKSLKDFLIDKKIPNRERDELLVIASENNVLAVIGIECGRTLKIDDNSKNIMSLSIN
ncbi:MAG: tRNA lysidine(34) synthetase TilS [Clostridia bacterium]